MLVFISFHTWSGSFLLLLLCLNNHYLPFWIVTGWRMNEGFIAESKNLQVLKAQLFFGEKRGDNFPTINFYIVELLRFFLCCHIKFMDKSSGKHHKSGCPAELEINEPLLFWQLFKTLVWFLKILFPAAKIAPALKWTPVLSGNFWHAPKLTVRDIKLLHLVIFDRYLDSEAPKMGTRRIGKGSKF